MKALKRFPVSKRRDVRHFNKQSGRTKSANVPRMVMRGGWRM